MDLFYGTQFVVRWGAVTTWGPRNDVYEMIVYLSERSIQNPNVPLDNPNFIMAEGDPTVEPDLEMKLDEVIAQVEERVRFQPGDRLGVTITGRTIEGLVYDIGVSFDENLTGYRILDIIRQKLNSSESLVLDFRMKFKKYTPVNRNNIQYLQARNKWTPIFQEYCSTSRSIVVINPEEDPDGDAGDCFPQFLGMALALLVKKNVPLPSCSFLDALTYKRCTSGNPINKFRNRHELARMITSTFQTVNNDSLIQKVQDHFHVRVVLHEFSNRFYRVYPSEEHCPVDEARPMLIGLIKDDHVNLVTNISALYSDSNEMNYCPHCFETYSSRKGCPNQCKGILRCSFCHSCTGMCHMCKTTECGRLGFSARPHSELTLGTRCTHCRGMCYTQLCSDLHQHVCRHLIGNRCDKCGSLSHRGSCSSSQCYLCGGDLDLLQPDSHQCFLKHGTLKRPSTSYWTFDFECYLNEDNQHVIYLATAWPMYPSRIIDLLLPHYPHQWLDQQDPRPVFVFFDEQVPLFYDFLTEQCLTDCIFFAHNSGKYDSILLEAGMFSKHGVLPQKITRGSKIMSMTYESNHLTISDSLCFIPSSLRSMSANFDIQELRKGYFPHKIMTTAYMDQSRRSNWLVPKPPASAFESSFPWNDQEAKTELNTFLEQFYQDDSLWDIRKDAIEYCISDTVLLGKTLIKFRENTMELTDPIPRAEGIRFQRFDPLLYVTLPSAVMAFYRSQVMPADTFSVIHRYSALCRKEAVQMTLFHYSERIEDIEWWPVINGVQLTAKIGNDYIWYVPCYDWGCPHCFSGSYRNVRTGVSMSSCYSLFKYTESQLANILENQSLIICMEHRWKEIQSKNNLDTIRTKYDHLIPIDPRDAYKGGCTEMYKLIVPHEFIIADFVSQYPTMMYGECSHPVNQRTIEWPMPVGRCNIIKFPAVTILDRLDKCGIIKCCVLPPRQLYAPFLGHKVPSFLGNQIYEVIYGLCRTCMEERHCHDCHHSDEERQFIGTWTLHEIYYAIELGYQITFITELWEYEGKTNTLFREFITPFVVSKILSKRKGIVNEQNEFTEIGLQVKRYIEELTGNECTPNQFQDKPALRTISKLMMNSFYGKWGQRSVWSQTTRAFNNEEGWKIFTKLITRNDIQINDFDLFHCPDRNETVLTAHYELNYSVSTGDAKKQDHIASYITAYGRQYLHMMVHHSGMDAMYTDTDSLVMIKRNVIPFEPGLRLGDFELEVSNGCLWVATGRKQYCYKLANDKVVVKQKGVSLNSSMKSIFTPENFFQMIERTLALFNEIKNKHQSFADAMKEFRKLDNRPELTVKQTRFDTVKNTAYGHKVTNESEKKTRFLCEALKRRITPRVLRNGTIILDTLPFGYTGPVE